MDEQVIQFFANYNTLIFLIWWLVGIVLGFYVWWFDEHALISCGIVTAIFWPIGMPMILIMHCWYILCRIGKFLEEKKQAMRYEFRPAPIDEYGEYLKAAYKELEEDRFYIP